MVHDVNEPVRLDGLLYRVRLYSWSDSDHILALVFHHLIADGWGLMLTMTRICERYNEIGKGAEPAPHVISCVTLGEADQEYVNGASSSADAAFWLKVFDSLPPPLFAPKDSSGRGIDSRAYLREIDLPYSLYEDLARIGEGFGASPLHAVLACVYAYFGRRQGVDDVVFGMATFNRRTAKERDTLGMAASVVPLRVATGFNCSFAECIAQIAQAIHRTYRRHRYPIGRLTKDLKLADKGRVRLFDIGVSQLVAPGGADALGGATVDALYQLISECDAKPLQIYLNALDPNRPFRISLVFNRGFFGEAELSEIGLGLREIMDCATRCPSIPISVASMVSPEARERLIRQLNDSVSLSVHDECVHEIFTRVAKANSEIPALVDGSGSITYGALNRSANRLAHRLRRMGVSTDAIVGLLADRSFGLIVGILGIMKAGAAYLPLDPSSPSSRLADVAIRGALRILVVAGEHNHSLAWVPAGVVILRLDDPGIDRESSNEPSNSVGADNLAYVIYTSGSSGEPKGVLIPHRGISSLAVAQFRLFQVGVGDRVLQFAPPGFDASIWNVVMALTVGATLCVPSSAALAAGSGLPKVLMENRVSVATLPPAVLPLLDPRQFPDLRTLISAGESCPPEIAQRWSTGRRFFNAYGPTEVTVCATVSLCNGGDSVPIGRPIANTQVYVLDESLSPTPPGVPGEIYVAGQGLARGYMGDPALTASSFVANPFAAGGRMYRTGDFARLSVNDEWEFLGRRDRQVKIRGFRVEPAEVERVLLRHARVNRAAVIARALSERVSLFAYVVMKDGNAADAEHDRKAIWNHLQSGLPDFMVPISITLVDTIPLTANGKVDEHALPSALVACAEPAGEQPTSELERIVRGIWAQVLGPRDLPSDINFFEAGGDSLKFARVLQLLNAERSVDLSFVDLFRHPTIRAQAAHLRSLAPGDSSDELRPASPRPNAKRWFLRHKAAAKRPDSQ